MFGLAPLSKFKSNHSLKQSHLNLRLKSRRVEGSTNRTHFCRISLLRNQTFRFQRSMQMKAYRGKQILACCQKSIKITEAIVVMDTTLIWRKSILSYTLISTLIARLKLWQKRMRCLWCRVGGPNTRQMRRYQKKTFQRPGISEILEDKTSQVKWEIRDTVVLAIHFRSSRPVSLVSKSRKA